MAEHDPRHSLKRLHAESSRDFGGAVLVQPCMPTGVLPISFDDWRLMARVESYLVLTLDVCSIVRKYMFLGSNKSCKLNGSYDMINLTDDSNWA